MERILFHIDVNSAYLSWSALKALQEGSSLDLRTVPSIVGGDQETRHGIVVARSIPAKKYGIKTADTVASAYQKCPNLINVKPDFAYYRARSAELMALLRDICPVIEQVSIDECYMDYEPIRGDFESPEAAAHYIKDKVRDTLGFTVNVGISNRKVLAKMASDFRKPDLVHTLYVWEIQEKMWNMPVGELHMCGKSSAAKLNTMGIYTIGDLARTDKKLVESWLKSAGTMLWNYANGIDDRGVNPVRAQAKGVGNSTTLAKNITRAEEAYPVLRELCASVGRRLREKQFLAGQISVEIRYATFTNVSHQTTLGTPVNESEALYRQAKELFDDLWNGEPVRLLGVRTTKLSEVGEPVQMDLFSFVKEKQKNEKQEKLDAAMKKINARFGDGAIKKGASAQTGEIRTRKD